MSSVKIKVRVDVKTLELLEQAFEAGHLADIGVTSLDTPPAPVAKPFPWQIITRVLSVAAILAACCSWWVAWMVVPSMLLAVAAAGTAYLARRGIVLALISGLAATAFTTVVLMPLTPQPSPVDIEQRLAKAEEVSKVANTTEIDVGKKRTFTLAISKEKSDRMNRRHVELRAALARNDKNFEELLLKALEESFKDAEEENTDGEYIVPQGERQLVIRVGESVAFKGHVTLPTDGEKIACSITELGQNRYTVKFTPPIR